LIKKEAHVNHQVNQVKTHDRKKGSARLNN